MFTYKYVHVRTILLANSIASLCSNYITELSLRMGSYILYTHYIQCTRRCIRYSGVSTCKCIFRICKICSYDQGY